MKSEKCASIDTRDHLGAIRASRLFCVRQLAAADTTTDPEPPRRRIFKVDRPGHAEVRPFQ